MDFNFDRGKITDLLLILPKKEVSFLDEMNRYKAPKARSLKLKEVMGYGFHRIVDSTTTSSDLAIFGLRYLLDEGILDKESIDGLIVVTQTPDHFVPPTSFVIQGELNLKKDMICLDITQGCAGFIIGLMQAFGLCQQKSVKKIVLINVDVMSRKVSNLDRNSYPLIGDGCAITIIDNSRYSQIFSNIYCDGSGRNALIIPAGGLKEPSSPQSAFLEEDAEGNIRSRDHLIMDGSAVFNFVQTMVPPMINNLIDKTKLNLDEIDYFAFHQPNQFMLKKLADKMGVPYIKMPMDIVGRFGNGSGITIPTVLNASLGTTLLKARKCVCLAGFGVGLTWGSMLTDIGPLDSCNTLYM